MPPKGKKETRYQTEMTVHSKAELMAAIQAVPFHGNTHILLQRKGGETHYRFHEPVTSYVNEHQFEKHLEKLCKTINKLPKEFFV